MGDDGMYNSIPANRLTKKVGEIAFYLLKPCKNFSEVMDVVGIINREVAFQGTMKRLHLREKKGFPLIKK